MHFWAITDGFRGCPRPIARQPVSSKTRQKLLFYFSCLHEIKLTSAGSVEDRLLNGWFAVVCLKMEGNAPHLRFIFLTNTGLTVWHQRLLICPLPVARLSPLFVLLLFHFSGFRPSVNFGDSHLPVEPRGQVARKRKSRMGREREEKRA